MFWGGNQLNDKTNSLTNLKSHIFFKHFWIKCGVGAYIHQVCDKLHSPLGNTWVSYSLRHLMNG